MGGWAWKQVSVHVLPEISLPQVLGACLYGHTARRSDRTTEGWPFDRIRIAVPGGWSSRVGVW